MKHLLVTVLLFVFAVGHSRAKSTYILGGSDAEETKYRWTGSVQYMFGRLHECGAAIISNKYILTAAHCVRNSPFARHLIAGLYNTEDWTKGRPEKIHFHGVYWHDDFNERDLTNDIAVIEMSRPLNVTTNPYIDTINMAPKDANLDGATCLITGWGATESGTKDPSGPLQKAEVKVLSDAECIAKWGDKIKPGMMCVENKGIAACGGDSGSPLVCNGPNGMVLAGISSFGTQNCDDSKPSVYTRISAYRDFINKKSGL